MKQAFVTGSTGMLGTNLVHLLIEQGWKVKALVRSEEKGRRMLAGLGVEFVLGDMEDIEAFAPAMAGCDVLFHGAAYFREYFSAGEHWEKLQRINVDGTRRILEAAEAQGVKKTIYVSSSGVIGLNPETGVGDEQAGPGTIAEENHYFKSKVLAEKEVFSFLETHAMPVVLILPGWMFGPHDAGPTAAGLMVLDFLKQNIPGVFEGGNSIVDVRDVAQGMIEAVERGKSGERYIIGGKIHSLQEVNRTLEKVSGVPAPRLKIPYPLLIVVAWFTQTLANLQGKQALMTVNGVRSMRDGLKLRLESAKAQRTFDLTFRPLEETLRDTVRWYRDNGFVINE